MIAVDTSVWADFFRGALPLVKDLLLAGHIVHPPTVTGELAMGNLRDRNRTIAFLQQMEPLTLPTDQAVLDFVDENDLYGTGIGWGDAQILCSVAHAGRCRLWTRDKRLHDQAVRLGVAYIVPA